MASSFLAQLESVSPFTLPYKGWQLAINKSPDSYVLLKMALSTKLISRYIGYSVIVLSYLLLHSCSDQLGYDPDSAEKSILEFNLRKYMLEASIDENNRIISFSVPAKVDLQKIIPEIVVSPGAVVEPPSLQQVDLSQPFDYLVTAPNGSQQTYTVISEQYTDTAFLIIDVQNGWALGAFNCDSVFANINLVADRARSANVPVIYVYDYSDYTVENYEPWELEIVEAIEPQAGDQVIVKKDVSDVFDESTSVQQVLNDEEVGVVVLSGMSSGACVNASSQGALNRGYVVIMISDGHTVSNDFSLTVDPEKFIEDFNELWASLGAEVIKAGDIYF